MSSSSNPDSSHADAAHPPPLAASSRRGDDDDATSSSTTPVTADGAAGSSSSALPPPLLRRRQGGGGGTGVQNLVDAEVAESSGATGGPGPVDLGLAADEDDEEEDDGEEDLEDYREDMLDIGGGGGGDDSDGASSNHDDDDDDEGDSDADLGAEEDIEGDDIDDPEETGEFNKPKEGEALIGCKHYRRRCALICSTCEKAFTCRFCHDEVEMKHELDRKAVIQIQCLECQRVQPVARHCVQCQVEFALYFCPLCRLYDDEDKNQYHCEGCKICRIGGRENFFHCQTCDMCLANNMRDNHKCIEKMSRSNCPVCLEDLHTSRKACRVPKCGHMLHFKCMQQLLKTGNYACPTCSVSMVDMSSVWERLDYEVELTPMPTEYRDLKVAVLCRDCHAESRSSFHILGQKCSQCGSYNTCRTADPGEGCCGAVDESAMEVREHQQAEAEDVAAAAVRELGLAANMRPEDDDDDDDEGDVDGADVDEDEDVSHYDRIRGLIHSLASAAGGASSSGASRSNGAGGSGGEGSSGSSGSSGEGSSGSGSSHDAVGGASGGEGPSGAAAMAPLYQDLEDDDELD